MRIGLALILGVALKLNGCFSSSFYEDNVIRYRKYGNVNCSIQDENKMLAHLSKGTRESQNNEKTEA